MINAGRAGEIQVRLLNADIDGLAGEIQARVEAGNQDLDWHGANAGVEGDHAGLSPWVRIG